MENSISVSGVRVDGESRCAHYHKKVDVVAIKFPCCHTFYACYECHQACADHPPEKWGKEKREELAILCGHCQQLMTIDTYMNTEKCTNCGHFYNQGCVKHYPLYFEV